MFMLARFTHESCCSQSFCSERDKATDISHQNLQRDDDSNGLADRLQMMPQRDVLHFVGEHGQQFLLSLD